MAYRQVRLGDYFKFEKGLGYKGEFLAEESDVAMIGMDSHNVGGGYKDNSEKPYSGPYKPEHVVEVGDVIFAATEQGFGLLASPLMVPDSAKFQTFIYSHHVLKAFPVKEGFLPEFLYNIFRVERFRDKAAYGDTGTTVRALPAEVLEDQLVPLPDLPTQQAINEIIALIDQQIANNKSLSHSLENLAQAMFKSWFIDFDPVHVKKSGEKPFAMDDETAALFPDSFEESELGMIPKGWAKGLLGDHVSPKKGISITKKSTRPGEIPVVAGGLEPAYFHDTSNSKYPSVAISASGANAGFVRLYLKDIWASDCSVLNSENSSHPYFWYLLLKHNQELIYSMQQGAAQPHIYPSDLMRIPTVVASRELLDKFEKFTTNIFMLVRNNELNSLSLSGIRDLLLPRLISGELQIPEEMLVS
jgi:restriction endonuclease S subunit